jgi:hypothetical protein
MRSRGLGGLALALALIAGAGAGAQTQTETQTSRPPAAPPAPGTPSATSPGTAPGSVTDPAAGAPAVREITGTLRKVDVTARTVEVSSGLFGLLGRTLEVTDDTQIRVEGRREGLAALRAGARVRADYESREGRNIAKAIEVMPDDQGRRSTP